ncbi:MAG TPA: hypothetical protein VJL90_11200 [Pseudorhodoplanes sp.]|nr:hypothetical protein [Pseudorhodoplanes sp.]
MHVQYVASCVAAFLLAALAPAFAMAVLSVQLAPITFYISLGHAVLLGLPLFFLFRERRWTSVFSSVAGGFVVGAIPIGFLAWPFWPGSGSSSSVNNVPLIINGMPTAAGWLSYFQNLIFFASFGALAGFVFWLVLKLSGSMAPEADRDRRRMTHWGVTTGLAAVAVLLAGAVVAVPSITKDRTCHNMGRDGGGTFSVKTRILLPVAHDDWPKLRKAFDDFSMKNELSLKDFNQARPDLASFFLDLSLCSDRGTNIFVNERNWSALAVGLPPSRGVGVYVYEVRPNSGWKGLVRELASELESAWPGKVHLRE